jgi:hypothetical protein
MTRSLIQTNKNRLKGGCGKNVYVVTFHNILFALNRKFLCFNAIFSNISAISGRPVLVVKEAGVPGENHQPWVSNW